jgi:hypothetical protein
MNEVQSLDDGVHFSQVRWECGIDGEDGSDVAAVRAGDDRG